MVSGGLDIFNEIIPWSMGGGSVHKGNRPLLSWVSAKVLKSSKQLGSKSGRVDFGGEDVAVEGGLAGTAGVKGKVVTDGDGVGAVVMRSTNNSTL